ERIKIARNASDYARRYFNIQTTAEFLEACINEARGYDKVLSEPVVVLSIASAKSSRFDYVARDP
ncbi:MAG: hypothetical protein PHP44_07970, partial [Kiritimatiellae bacterium]|nr:hypothetical protein [Kiritimatiellia bacterium]